MIAPVIGFLLCVASYAAGYWYRGFVAWLLDGEGGQDRKFRFVAGRFVNRVSGEEIPLHEPVIIFRARDRHAVRVLQFYLGLAVDEHHRAAIRERIADFQRFADYHAVKEPGITHDFRLRDGCGWLGCETYDPARCAGCHGAP